MHAEEHEYKYPIPKRDVVGFCDLCVFTPGAKPVFQAFELNSAPWVDWESAPGLAHFDLYVLAKRIGKEVGEI